VDVIAAPEGQLIEWRVNPEYTFVGDYQEFFVEFAVAGGDWKRLNITPILNETAYVDTEIRRFNLNDDNSYRVIVRDVIGTGYEEEASIPALVNGNWNWRDWRLARDIIRKEYLALTRYTGTPGYLLKERPIGVPCPVCREYDIGAPSTAQCPNCRGTGLVNGYYDAVPFYIALGEQQRNFDKTQDNGLASGSHLRTGRCIMYPRIEQDDIWVEAQTNIRYAVQAVQLASVLRGKPLVANVSLRVVSGVDHIIQEIPETEPDDGSGNTTGGWQTDIGNAQW
jgi:hypothetical protein